MKALKFALAGLFALILAAPAVAQNKITLAYGFDLDGEAADVDQVVVAATLADSTSFTIAAQPDTCRVIDLTVVDADSSITDGEVTVVGTDCLGFVRTVVYTVTGGSGVKSAQSTYRSAYFKTVTSVTSGVLTGEGGAGDTLAVGYSTAPPATKTGYGLMRGTESDTGYRYIDLGRSVRLNNFKVTTNDVYTTSLTEVTAGEDPFDYVSVNDILVFNISGEIFQRKVVTWTDDSNVVLNAAIDIPAAGVGFEVMHFYSSADPYDIIAVNVGPWDTATFGWSVDANANTGGVTYVLKCSGHEGPEWPNGIWYTITSDNTASAATQTPLTDTITLSSAAFSHCQVSWEFGTGDDVDAAAEDLNAEVLLRKDESR